MKNNNNKVLALALNFMLTENKPLFVNENYDLAKEKGYKGKPKDLIDVYRPDYPVMAGDILNANDFATLQVLQQFLTVNPSITDKDLKGILTTSNTLYTVLSSKGKETYVLRDDLRTKFNKCEFEFINKMQGNIKNFCDTVRTQTATGMAIFVANFIAETEKFDEFYNPNSTFEM